MRNSKRRAYAEAKARKETQNIVTVFGLLIAIIVLAYVVINNENKTVEKTPQQVHEDEYLGLIARISPTNVRAGVIPVHIWSEKNGATNHLCTGGLFTDKADQKTYVLTCGHAFWNTTDDKEPQRYYYQILQPYNKRLYPISRVVQVERVEQNAVSASKDVLVCIPGESSVIAPINNSEQGDGYRDIKVKFSKEKRITAFSTVTGQPVEYVGIVKMEDGIILAVLDYPSFEGESGTLFAGLNNQIYILSRTIPVTDLVAKTFDIPLEHRKVSLCSMVTLK
jgi:hypothetical protein